MEPDANIGAYTIVGAGGVAILAGNAGDNNTSAATGHMKVSVLLLTFNEATNLQRCLDALDWCGDIAIVDSGSTDGTLEIAHGCNIRVLHRRFDDFASQRNFGLTEAGF